MQDFATYLLKALQRTEVPLFEQQCQKEDNDVLMVNSALLMRIFEMIHEDVKNDVEMHFILEKMFDIYHNKQCVLTMDDYDEICDSIEHESESLDRRTKVVQQDSDEDQDEDDLDSDEGDLDSEEDEDEQDELDSDEDQDEDDLDSEEDEDEQDLDSEDELDSDEDDLDSEDEQDEQDLDLEDELNSDEDDLDSEEDEDEQDRQDAEYVDFDRELDLSYMQPTEREKFITNQEDEVVAV